MAQKKDIKTGKWFFYGKYNDDISQKKKNYKKRGFDSRTKARLAEADYLKDLKNKSVGKVKFKVACDEYFKSAEKTLKASSIVSQRNKAKNHLNTYFDNLFIDKITVSTIADWKNTIDKKNLSLSYKRYIYTLLNTIMNYAAKYYDINNNAVKIEGNFKNQKTIEKNHVDFWTLEEFEKFNKVIDHLEYKTFFNFLYWTGCRRGEAIALTWEDFTKGLKTVKITKSCTHKVTGVPYMITSPKNTSSIRNISIPNSLIFLLQELYNEDSKIDGFNNKFFVFGKTKPLHDTSIARYKNKYCEMANVKKIRIHDLRHSHASYLINNMPNDKNIMLAISSRLGHSNLTTTLQVYAHMMPDQEDKILEMLNK